MSADRRFSLCAIVVCMCMVQAAVCQNTFTVVSYNCENVFDTVHDEGKEDYEFLPEGDRHWTRSRLYRKLRNIGKVVMAADSVRPVDVVCLLEVENDTVMTYLTTRTPLRNIGYEYVMTHSDDARGIDIALMYSPFTFRPVEVRSISSSADVRTRDILFVSGVVCSGDTVDIYVVHLPSKLNGLQSDRARAGIGRHLRADADSVMKARSKPYMMIMGDFNSSATSAVVSKVIGAGPVKDGRTFAPYTLYNLMSGRKGGTYKYRSQWTTIDHILVNGNLLSADSSVHTSYASSGILSLPFLLEPDSVYGGFRPRRTYRGFKYAGGFSDHLPVYARFVIKL